MIRRFEGWEQRLGDLFTSSRKKAFEWGVFDCFLWPCDAILALTQFDLAAGFRGTYSTEIDALRIVREFTGPEVRIEDAVSVLAERFAAQLGAQPIYATRARRGDIALVLGEHAHRETFAVVDTSARRLATVSPSGLRSLPLSSGLRFWAVG